MRYDAFISHSGADLGAATRLNDDLKAGGIKTFFAPHDLPGACKVPAGLASAIEEANVLVLLVSPSSVESRWVQMEADIASRLGRTVAPVRLRDFYVPVGNGLYPYTFDLNYIDLFPDWTAGEARLVRLLKSDRSVDPGETASDVRHAVQSEAKATHPASPSPPASVKVDTKAILEDLQRRVARGEPEAMYALGRYLLNKETTSDDAQAVRLIRLASEGANGLPQALHTLADCYRKDRGVGRNYAKMLRLYELAAMRGYAPSFYNLGRAYENGWGVSVDSGRAYRRYAAGANLGFAPAQFAVARMNFAGIGVPVNDANALSFAQMAAARHYGPALNLMGRLYRKGRGVVQSDAEACVWYQKAADQGDVAGIVNLASMYERGLGVQKDEARSRALRGVADEIANQLGE